MAGIFRALALTFAIAGVSADAAQLTYVCDGLWSTSIAVLKATATMEGSFEPNGCNFTARISLETGGVMSGSFSGADPYFSSGTLQLEGGNLAYAGSLTKISTVNGHGGFRFNANEAMALFSCHLN